MPLQPRCSPTRRVDKSFINLAGTPACCPGGRPLVVDREALPIVASAAWVSCWFGDVPHSKPRGAALTERRVELGRHLDREHHPRLLFRRPLGQLLELVLG